MALAAVTLKTFRTICNGGIIFLESNLYAIISYRQTLRQSKKITPQLRGYLFFEHYLISNLKFIKICFKFVQTSPDTTELRNGSPVINKEAKAVFNFAESV